MLKPPKFIPAVISITFIVLLASSPIAAQSIDDPTPAFEAALAQLNAQAGPNENYVLGQVRYNGAWAYAIVVPDSGHLAHDHTQHSFVPLIGTFARDGWLVLTPSPANAAQFNATLFRLPTTLMDDATKNFVAQPIDQSTNGPTAVSNFGGHRLPWAKGLRGYVAQRDGSGHVSQVDFDIIGLQGAGDVVASKAGTVVFVKESSNSGSCSGADFSTVWKQANIVVVRHSTTEYSWYVHLAQNSVPVNVGDVVASGTKIGVEGTTGFACGVHVHFMVSSAIPATWTNPANPNEAPWAPSGSLQPTDFDESSWANLAAGTWLTSQNDPNGPCPAPALQAPADGAVVTTTTPILVWSGVGNCAFDGYTLRVKTNSNPDTGGTTLLDASTNALSRTVSISSTHFYQDLYWSVRANGAGAAWVTRRLRVEPAITGTFSLFDGGQFVGNVLTGSTSISDLLDVDFDNRAQSLTLDAGVGLVLCAEANLRGDCGRATGPTQVPSLDALADGLSGNVSSLRVCAGECPPAPTAPQIQSPISSTVVFSGTPVSLVWAGTADEFNVEVSGGALGNMLPFSWASGNGRNIGALGATDKPYFWRVRGANAFGTGPWAEQTFVVVEGQSVFLPVTLR